VIRWQFENHDARRSHVKVYIFSDMEGVAGIEEFDNREDTSYANVMLRRRNQHLLTQELNAAAAGAFDGGAEEVVIKMGHHDSILYEELDERVVFIRDGITWLQGIDEHVDACFFVGSHSKAGTPDGVLAHTWGRGVKGWFVNDVELGELGIYALIAGCYGIPYVFHSGDAAGCREAEALIPGVVTAAVKKGYGTHSAAHLSKERARALIRERARQSMSFVGQIAPFTVHPNPGSPLYVFRQVTHKGERTVSDDGKGMRVTAPDTVEYYGDDLLAVLRRGTY
jgi:D-amino peptidase